MATGLNLKDPHGLYQSDYRTTLPADVSCYRWTPAIGDPATPLNCIGRLTASTSGTPNDHCCIRGDCRPGHPWHCVFIGSSSGRGACPRSRRLWASVGTVGWQSPRVGYTQLGLAYCGRGFDTTCGTWPELCGDWVSRADGGRRSYSDGKADGGSRDVGDRYLGYCSRNNSKPCPLVLVGSGARDLQPTPASRLRLGPGIRTGSGVRIPMWAQVHIEGISPN